MVSKMVSVSNSQVVTSINNLIKVLNSSGTSTAVDNISLSIPKGIVISLLGSNGAGKSTTIKMISCVLVPTKGTMSILGRELKGNERWIKNKIGVVPQENNLDPDFNT